jgi:hypothetical protein
VRRIAPAVVAFASLVVTAAAVEVVLRTAGYRPARTLVFGPPRATIHEPDPHLGWRNKAGAFIWPGRGEDIRLTFWPGGMRATGPAPVAGYRSVLVLGCSFTQGWAVSDDETFPWKLQASFPTTRFVNLGTAGYGTYQSLLAMERYLQNTRDSPDIVLYGFSDFHQSRNVGTAQRLRSVRQTSDEAAVIVPFVSIDERGNLRRHPPDAYPHWPLRKHSAAVAFLEERYVELRTRRRGATEKSVTQELLRTMLSMIDRMGAKFVVVVLSASDPQATTSYVDFMRSIGIAVVDCTHREFHSLGMKVPVYGHPNSTMNAYWATCIEQYLRSLGLS